MSFPSVPQQQWEVEPPVVQTQPGPPGPKGEPGEPGPPGPAVGMLTVERTTPFKIAEANTPEKVLELTVPEAGDYLFLAQFGYFGMVNPNIRIVLNGTIVSEAEPLIGTMNVVTYAEVASVEPGAVVTLEVISESTAGESVPPENAPDTRLSALKLS